MRPITAPTAAVIMYVIVPMLLACPTTSDAELLAADGAGSELEMADASGDARSVTGIAGQVIIRPVRSRETAGMPNSSPYQATIQVLTPSGEPVTTFQSDPGGNFRVALPPGKYVLRPQSPGHYPRASEQTVVVSSSGLTQVRIVYDSGIR